MRKLILGTIFLIPAYAGAEVWAEAGAGPWIPFFGAFSTNHSLGIAAKVKAGMLTTPPDWLIVSIPFIDPNTRIAPFFEVYHTWNQLKESVWEVEDGDTIKSGNMIYVGLGAKVIFNNHKSLSYGYSMSMGLLNEYPATGSNIVGGGSHSPPKFMPSLFLSAFVIYNVSNHFYLFAEGTSESLGSFTGGYTGWGEATAGFGLRF